MSICIYLVGEVVVDDDVDSLDVDASAEQISGYEYEYVYVYVC
jgi:hypothetical protein